MRRGGDRDPGSSPVPWAASAPDHVSRPRWLDSRPAAFAAVPFDTPSPPEVSAVPAGRDERPIGASSAELEAALHAALGHVEVDEPVVAPAVAEPIDCGHDAELAALAAEVEALQAEVVALATSADRVRRELLERCEGDVVELAAMLAERIVGRELATDRTLLARWARDGLAALGEEQDGEIVVSQDVFDSVPRTAWVDGRGRPLVPRVDPKLGPGACEVRGPWSRIDGSAAARIRAVVEAMIGAGSR